MNSNISIIGQYNAIPLSFNPVLWIDGADVNGTGPSANPSNGTSLSSWIDKTGWKNNASQAIGANQPVFNTNILNSLPSVTFSGSKSMSMTNTDPNILYTCFVVGQTTAPTVAQVYYANGSGGSNGQAIVLTSPAKKFGCLYGNSAWLEDGNPDTLPHIFCGTWNGSVSLYYIGNVSQSITGSTFAPITPSGTSKIGSDNLGGAGLQGYVSEIIYYGKTLSMAQITSIYNYLHSKWNV